MPCKRGAESDQSPLPTPVQSSCPPLPLRGPTWFLTLVTAPFLLQSHSDGAESPVDLSRRMFLPRYSLRRGFR